MELDKGEFFIIKYDGNGAGSRKMNLILQENINLSADERAVKSLRDPNKLPWDVVVIMTTKWVLVARPPPQKTKKTTEIQASRIWAEAENLLKDDKNPREINKIICCFLAANDNEVAGLKLHADMHPIQVEERANSYKKIFENGANILGRCDDFIFEEKHYFLGHGPGPGNQTTNLKSQIVVHDLDTFKGVAEYEKLRTAIDDNSYMKIKQKGLRFPLISLMAQDSFNSLSKYGVVKTDMENSSVLWYL